ncbi:MAG: diguanylate cyclase, partial [Oscillospiraceae bacterium]
MILVALCIALSVSLSIHMVFAFKWKKRAVEIKDRYTNYDRLTGIGKKVKMQGDYKAYKEIDGLAIVTIHLKRFSEMYNLFGLQAGDKVLKNFSGRLSDFAQKNSGVAYRG